MKTEYKTFATSTKAAADEPEGIVSAIVSVFGSADSSGEIVEPGFFDELKTRLTPDGLPAMKLVMGHDWLLPIGKVLEASELAPGDARLPDRIKADGGLFIKGALNLDTQRGREAYSDLKFGALTEWSFGYAVTKDSYDAAGTRHLIAGTTYEASPVVAGMHPQTETLSVKAADAGVRGRKDYGDMNASPFAFPLLASYEDLQNDLSEQAQGLMAVWAARDLAGMLGDPDDLVNSGACAVLVATLPTEAVFFLCPDPWSDPDDGVYVRVPYTMDPSNGEPMLGTPTAVQPAYVPVNPAQVLDSASRMARGARGLAQKAATLRHSVAGKEGRVISSPNRSQLQSCLDALGDAQKVIEDLLAASEPPEKAAGRRVYGEHLRTLARLRGVPV